MPRIAHRGCYLQDFDDVLCPHCRKRFDEPDAEYYEHVDHCGQAIEYVDPCNT